MRKIILVLFASVCLLGCNKYDGKKILENTTMTDIITVKGVGNLLGQEAVISSKVVDLETLDVLVETELKCDIDSTEFTEVVNYERGGE